MNKDFPRVMKMLRRERGLRQKEAAEQLGVAQALLSHYENGKRECGLDFLVHAADFYGVSVDFILGRTSSRSGVVVAEEDLPESTVSESYNTGIEGTGIILQKKLATNALEVIFSLLLKAKNAKLAKAVCSYISTAIYRIFRMVYSAGGANDENRFSVPGEKVTGTVGAKLSLVDISALDAIKEGTADEPISDSRIEQEYPRQSAALFLVVNNVERELNKL